MFVVKVSNRKRQIQNVGTKNVQEYVLGMIHHVSFCHWMCHVPCSVTLQPCSCSNHQNLYPGIEEFAVNCR